MMHLLIQFLRRGMSLLMILEGTYLPIDWSSCGKSGKRNVLKYKRVEKVAIESKETMGTIGLLLESIA